MSIVQEFWNHKFRFFSFKLENISRAELLFPNHERRRIPKICLQYMENWYREKLNKSNIPKTDQPTNQLITLRVAVHIV